MQKYAFRIHILFVIVSRRNSSERCLSSQRVGGWQVPWRIKPGTERLHVIAYWEYCDNHHTSTPLFPRDPKKCVQPMPPQCRASVADAGPALRRHWLTFHFRSRLAGCARAFSLGRAPGRGCYTVYRHNGRDAWQEKSPRLPTKYRPASNYLKIHNIPKRYVKTDNLKYHVISIFTKGSQTKQSRIGNLSCVSSQCSLNGRHVLCNT